MEKRNMHRARIKNLILITLFCFVSPLIYGTNITVAPDQILFDYDDASYAHDALTIRNATGGTAYMPEWYPFDNQYNPVAYIKGQSNRKIKVRFESNYSGIVHLIVILSVSTGRGIGTICNLFIPNYDTSSGETQELSLMGTLPDSVSKQVFTWKWDIYAIPVNTTGYCAAWTPSSYTTHTYYTLLAAPQAPMEQPWSSVLEKACTWASLKSTDSDVLNALTTKLYSESGLKYSSGITHYKRVYGINHYVSVFYLSELLYDWKYVDCRDVSMFLSILSSSIGASLTQTRRINGWFDTKSIIPIGQTATTTSWYFHQVGWQNNVYDACIKFNTSPNRIPINENIDNPYKLDLVDPCTTCQQNWTPLNAFRLGETDPYFNDPTEIR